MTTARSKLSFISLPVNKVKAASVYPDDVVLYVAGVTCKGKKKSESINTLRIWMYCLVELAFVICTYS